MTTLVTKLFANFIIIVSNINFIFAQYMKTIISTDIEQANYFLDNGEVVAIPTETVYGLAGNALSDSTLLKIYKTKNRPSFDPLIVHLDSIDKTEKFVQSMPEVIKKLAEKFSPGPLT